MRVQLAALWRYRPRALTLIVLLVVGAVVVLANLSVDQGWNRGDGSDRGWDFSHKSYGWPLIWHRYVSVISNVHRGDIGWYCSALRLAGNLAMWLVMLAAPAATCEWLLRRYPPRFRWSLRTMLAAIGLTAMLCAWLAAARERARLQDPIIGVAKVQVDRWGPKWLDIIGADRFRRRIIFVVLEAKAGNEEDLEILKRLRRLPKLRHLEVEVDYLTPEIAEALSELRQLRNLSITESGEINTEDGSQEITDAEQREWQASLRAIGNMTQLEYLHMSEPTVCGERLARLASVPKLKSLCIDGFAGHEDAPSSHACLQAVGKITQLECLELHWMRVRAESLSRLDGLTNLELLTLAYVRTDGPPLFGGLPPLPRLKAIDISDSPVVDQDLRRLAILPRLKSLGLDDTHVTPEGLRRFGSLGSLEELTLENEKLVAGGGLESLIAFKRLKRLHVGRNDFLAYTHYGRLTLNHRDIVKVEENQLDRCRRALQALRKSRPGIVIDRDIFAIRDAWLEKSMPAFEHDVGPFRDSAWLPAGYLRWMTPSERANFEKAEGWANFSGAGYRAEDGHRITTSF